MPIPTTFPKKWIIGGDMTPTYTVLYNLIFQQNYLIILNLCKGTIFNESFNNYNNFIFY